MRGLPNRLFRVLRDLRVLRVWLPGLAVFFAGALVSATPQSLSVSASLDRYSQGAHEEAIDRLDAGALSVDTFLAQLERWTTTGEIDAVELARRRTIAAAFALDAVWAKTTTRPMVFMQSLASHDVLGQPVRGRPFPPPGAVLPVVAWGCQWMSASRVPSPAERAWWLLSVAMLEDAQEWRSLLGMPRWTLPLPGGAATRRDIAEGHLTHARARFPDELHWRLAEVLANMQELVGLHAAQAVGPAARGLFFEGRYDVLRHAEQAVRGLNTGRLNDLERDLRQLAEVEALSADATARLGYLRMLRREWKDALAHFDAASVRTDADKLLNTAIDYFRGWVFERTDWPAEALAAYERAYKTVPSDQNLSSLFAAQLFLAGRREEAAQILDGLWRNPTPTDLVMAFEAGDARHAREYVRQMREALR